MSATTWNEDRELVERLQRAVAKSVQYASDHPDEVRSVLISAYDTPPELANAMRLPAFLTTWPTIEDVQQVADDLRETGVLEEDVDLTDYLLPEPPAA